MASVVLADPGQQHKSGLVLSLAPLMGAAAQVDSSHPKWLHVHVRPPVRGLLKLLKVGRVFMHPPHAVGVTVVSVCSMMSISSWQYRTRLLCAWIGVCFACEVYVQHQQSCGCILRGCYVGSCCWEIADLSCLCCVLLVLSCLSMHLAGRHLDPTRGGSRRSHMAARVGVCLLITVYAHECSHC